MTGRTEPRSNPGTSQNFFPDAGALQNFLKVLPAMTEPRHPASLRTARGPRIAEPALRHENLETYPFPGLSGFPDGYACYGQDLA